MNKLTKANVQGTIKFSLEDQKIRTDLLLLLIFSLIYMLPFFLRSGITHFALQDTYFHLGRIIGLSNVFGHPVNFLAFNQIGSDLNQFYPWLTLYPAYLFYKLTGSLVVGFKLYLWFLTFFTMAIAYYSMLLIKQNRMTAMLFALIYSFATYRTTDLIFRMALGEGIALTFLPLILAGSYLIFFTDYKRWQPLMVGMTLLFYTHLLSVAMIVPILFLIMVLTFPFWTEKKERFIALLKAASGTCLLALAFLIPFFQQMSFQKLNTPAGIELHGESLQNVVTNTLANRIYTYTPGLVLFIGLFFVLLKIKKLSKFDLLLYFLGVVAFISLTTLLPWQKLAETILLNLQFVWRLNTFVTLFLAYSFSVAFSSEKKYLYKTRVLAMAVLIIPLHFLAVNSLYTKAVIYNGAVGENEQRVQLTEQQVYQASTEFYNVDYLNTAVLKDKTALDDHLFWLGNKRITPKVQVTDSELTITLNNPGKKSSLVTPILRYKGQQVFINNQKTLSRLSKNGTTEISVPRGKSTIIIKTNYTFSARLASLISLATIVYLVLNKYPNGWKKIKAQASRLTK